MFMSEQLIKSILENKIIAIVRGANVKQAVKSAKAVYQGGIRFIEVTFNQKSPDTFQDTVNAIKQIKIHCPNMHVGAGTVLNVEQVELANSAGAEYIISPDTDKDVIERTKKLGLISIPGAYTASEAKKANNYGADFVKLFPCTDPQYLKALKAPLSHINFLAVGGVNVQNACDFIKAGAEGVGIGSSLINKKLLDAEEYDKITKTASELVEKLKNA